AKLLQSANRERQRQPGKTPRPEQRQRKQGEEHKRRQYKRAATVFVRQMRDRDVTEHRREHLDRDQVTELLRIKSAVVDHPENDEREGNSFAKPNQDIARQQLAQGR